jgi:hypothetical protein
MIKMKEEPNKPYGNSCFDQFSIRKKTGGVAWIIFLAVSLFVIWSFNHPDRNQVKPKIYYVDQTAGDDSNSGVSPESAWKHCPGMATYKGSLLLKAGDTVYFDSADRWIVTGRQGILLTGGVTYIGDSWGAGIRAEIMAGEDLPSGVVQFRDHPSIPTIFKGFNVDANKRVATGIDINHTQSMMMNGATKRVENCVIHDVWSRTSLGQYTYGIIISNYRGPDGYCENVEIINCKVHDVSRDLNMSLSQRQGRQPYKEYYRKGLRSF